MRAALLFIVFFLAHVGAHPNYPGGCSALNGHGLGSYNSDPFGFGGYWKLEHDGGNTVSPNDRVVVKLYEEQQKGDWPIKGFIFKTSAGTLTAKSSHAAAVSACPGAIGHTESSGKAVAEAYLDLPSSEGTVTVTAELVQSKASVYKLTLDIEVVDARATGGTITTFGDYIIHNFTSSGIFTVTDSSLTEVEVLVVGGGGGGGSPYGGGGGGGGAVEHNANKALSSSSITVTVGNGGIGADPTASAGDGYPSIFDDLVANGGLGVIDSEQGGASGSGSAGGSGIANNAGGGGGGDGGPGNAAVHIQDGAGYSYYRGGAGGPGVESAISGTSNFYGGGGGGGGDDVPDIAGIGGLGGGGSGSIDFDGDPGLAFTGGGGGGCGGGAYEGGSGGSGVVAVRYKKKAAVTPSCTTSQYLKDGACVACATGTTSTGGSATECTASSSSSSCSSSRATGGTVTTSGEYTIHTFKVTDSTFEVTDSTLTAVDVLVVGGGGAGDAAYMESPDSNGGGGGGGEVISASGMIVSKRGYSVTVGDGGSGGDPSNPSGSNGGTSEFNGLFADGGGRGSDTGPAGAYSGSGNPGGAGNIESSGGGGGAGAPGGDAIENADQSEGGNGGDGIQSDISGTATFYGGGGGGSCEVHKEGAGGRGGGGNGYGGYIAMGSKVNSQPGTPNTGGGGGGGNEQHDNDYGGSGGSGVVIVRYMSATCSQSPSPSTPSPSAQDKKKQAETTRDSILDDISDTRVKAKAKLLADAAIAGVKVQKLLAKITAADEGTACSETFSKAGMSAGDGACVATAASSGKRRRLSAMAYDVELMFSASTVNDDALKAAELELKNNGVEGVTSQTSVDPIAELKTVPGVDMSKLQTFETEASAAAEATAAEAQTPPPPTPPPPNLVLDDDDGTVGLVGKAGLLMATAFAILAM